MSFFRFGALLALLVVSLFAKPNVSGDWKLNNSKSDLGPMPPPSSMTMKIAHDDPKLKVAVKQVGDQGEFEWEAAYTTDGKESKNEVRGNPSVSVVKWAGDALVLDTKAKWEDNELTINDKWTLSEDGKTLTVERKFSSSMGEMQQKLVFEK